MSPILLKCTYLIGGPAQKGRKITRVKISKTKYEVQLYHFRSRTVVNSFNFLCNSGIITSSQANSQTSCEGGMKYKHKATLQISATITIIVCII